MDYLLTDSVRLTTDKEDPCPKHRKRRSKAAVVALETTSVAEKELRLPIKTLKDRRQPTGEEAVVVAVIVPKKRATPKP